MRNFIFFTFFGLASLNVSAESDIDMFEKTKISLVQAIQTAEQHTGGKAYEADIEDHSFKPEFEISILKDKKPIEITIDGVTGLVIKTREKKQGKK